MTWPKSGGPGIYFVTEAPSREDAEVIVVFLLNRDYHIKGTTLSTAPERSASDFMGEVYFLDGDGRTVRSKAA